MLDASSSRPLAYHPTVVMDVRAKMARGISRPVWFVGDCLSLFGERDAPSDIPLSLAAHGPAPPTQRPALTSSTTMPIAPITGKLRKRFWLDVSCALGLGISAGYTFWYGVHLKHGEPLVPRLARVQKQEAYYLRLERARQQQA
ncbi:hypothetical protein NM688_g2609 [Phlebia brevispora]|uniref:Uncharacterized protein n=1 Tax=Phlebia brevispora TaxID=194682 RepID=A0ACC1T803_9APHY|nr:hypothetical protein NM688_g2609 [Phlebia brevispora]